MSFKREGDDPALLNILKKRRIEEIGCEDIPTDEAKKLRDGRFTCLVCGSKHIFDTISILQIHRKTAKHGNYLKYFEKKKVETLQQIEKRLTENDKDHVHLLQKKKSLLSDNKKAFDNRPKYKSYHQPKVRLEMCATGPKLNTTKLKKKWVPTNDVPISTTQNHKLCLEKVTKTVPMKKFEEYKLRQQLNEDEKQKLVMKEIEMRSQGWIRDNTGEWKKDPDVEFDSDDDQPPT